MFQRLLVLFFFFICASAFSQSRDIVWIEAELELMDGTLMKGFANYNLRGHIVQLNTGRGTQTIRENQIKYMTLKKEELRLDLQLVAYRDENDEVQVMLAEIVHQSPDHYSFIRRYEAERQRLVHGVYTTTSVSLSPDFNADSFIFERKRWSRKYYKRYLLNYEGHRVDATRKWFFRTHPDQKAQVKKFVDDNILKFNSDVHMVDILKYYESLK